MLAAAGLVRLGFERSIAGRFSPSEMLPACGQGALGLECREDDPEVRELFRRTLARDKLSVIEAGNGAAALRVLRDHRPSVILLDLMMPVMDGFEFVSEFNQHPEWHGIPIIVVTARHITREDREALAVSARAFLQKSGFTQEEMLSKVLEMVRQHVVPGK